MKQNKILNTSSKGRTRYKINYYKIVRFSRIHVANAMFQISVSGHSLFMYTIIYIFVS